MQKILGIIVVVAFAMSESSVDARTFICRYAMACIVQGGCDLVYGKRPGVRPFAVAVDAAARTVDGLPASAHGSKLTWKRIDQSGTIETYELDRSTGHYQRSFHRADSTVGMVAWANCSRFE